MWQAWYKGELVGTFKFEVLARKAITKLVGDTHNANACDKWADAKIIKV